MNFQKYKYQSIEFLKSHKEQWPIAILFLVGLILIHQGISNYKKSLGLGESITEILVASQLLSEGQTLTDQNVEIQKIPSKYTPMGVLKPADLYKINGQALIRTVSKGEMVLWNALDMNYSYQSASTKIEEGYRAVSIAVDQISSVSHLIKSGDHVDLITTLEIPGENKPSTLTLLQNVSVLSTGEGTDDEQKGYGSITLMVLPEEANIITHSAKYGSLSLVLRNPLDMKTNKSLGIVSDQDIVQAAFRNHLQSERDLNSKMEK